MSTIRRRLDALEDRMDKERLSDETRRVVIMLADDPISDDVRQTDIVLRVTPEQFEETREIAERVRAGYVN